MVAYHSHGNSGTFVNGRRLYHRKNTGKSGTIGKVINFAGTVRNTATFLTIYTKQTSKETFSVKLSVTANGTRPIPVIPSRRKKMLTITHYKIFFRNIHVYGNQPVCMA